MFSGELERELLLRELTRQLAYWTPLIALLLLSLVLVGLKRVSAPSPWTERLLRPPFYFVSLPIATLTAGMEMLAWVIHYLTEGAGEVSLGALFLAKLFALSLLVRIFPLESFVFAIVSGVFVAALALSSYSLLRTPLREGDLRCPARQTKRRLEAVFLLAAFVWAWVSVRYVIVHWETPLVPHASGS
ncbi:hypothetical protein [Bradyrhizobium genosp. A]|uniref:hypothetical protein n=1 Tax=Bradyrhizobium genosp. A TaxID=83626 RepID=UPI003CF2632B